MFGRWTSVFNKMATTSIHRLGITEYLINENNIDNSNNNTNNNNKRKNKINCSNTFCRSFNDRDKHHANDIEDPKFGAFKKICFKH